MPITEKIVLQNMINGEFVDAADGATEDVINPSTGEVIAFVPGTGDIGRGVAFDIDPRYPGYELLTSSGGVYAADGTLIQASSNAFLNFGIW